MSINSRLKQAISSFIAGSIDPGYASDSKTSELYERYIFKIILGAAKNEGASIFYLDTFGNPPQSLLFRESPGQIYATDKPYIYSIIEFPGKPLLEVHVGVRVQGVSQVSHECDVCVLYQEEANRCRVERQEPDCSRIVIAVECKHMETKKYVYWQDEEMWIGYLEEYPDYWTQAETEDELKENLVDIYKELTSGAISNVRRVAELEVS